MLAPPLCPPSPRPRAPGFGQVEFLQKSVEVYLAEVTKQLQMAAKLRRSAAPVCSRTTLYLHSSHTPTPKLGRSAAPVLFPTPHLHTKPQTDRTWLLCCPSTHTHITHNTHAHTQRHTHTHSQIHTHTHTHTQAGSRSPTSSDAGEWATITYQDFENAQQFAPEGLQVEIVYACSM